MRALEPALLFGVALLAGCSTTASDIPPTRVPGGVPPASSASVADQIVGLTNRERVTAGQAALIREERLMRAAQIHAGQMAAAGRMEHVIPGAPYPTPESRLVAVGYRYAASAENISWNQPSPEAAISSWMRSAAHRGNLLNRAYTEVGAGYAVSTSGESYYVQVFGRPR